MFSRSNSGSDIFATSSETSEDDDVKEIGERGVVGAENENVKLVYKSPSLDEINAKLNQLAMAGGFGISDDMFKNDDLESTILQK